MSSRREQSPAVEAEARRLRRELGLEVLPIDPFDVARRLDIALRPLPPTAGGASGMLLRVGECFGICYPTHLANDGFIRFSVAHEIGHYCLPGHVDAVLKEGPHHSRAGFQSTNRYEREADGFAAALLMPKTLCRAVIARSGEGLAAIEALAAACRTSLEATAIRFADLAKEPMAVVSSKGRLVDYVAMSPSLKDFPRIEWVRQGTPLPLGTVTAAFNADPRRVEGGWRDEGKSCLQDWFNGPDRQEILEEVVGLGSYGKTLTVLTGMESPDSFEDEDAELERSWEPRFR